MEYEQLNTAENIEQLKKVYLEVLGIDDVEVDVKISEEKKTITWESLDHRAFDVDANDLVEKLKTSQLNDFLFLRNFHCI